MVENSKIVTGVTQQHPSFEAQLQATLNMIPAHAWYAVPSSALTFVLAESRGRISGPSWAAAKLGIPPSTLDHRIKALKIHLQLPLKTDQNHQIHQIHEIPQNRNPFFGGLDRALRFFSAR